MSVGVTRPRRLAADATPVVLALGVAAAGLWVGARTLGVQAARSDVEFAARLDGGSAEIMGTRSRRLLEKGDIRAAESLALNALRRDPTAVAAVQTVGLAAQIAGDDRKADQLLSYAQRLSRRDLQTHLWAIERNVARGDTEAVLREYDLALRTSIPARDLLFPILGTAMADPVVTRGLVRRLGGRSPWGEAFLSFAAGDPRVVPATAVRFLETARAAGVRATAVDLAVLAARSLEAQEPRTAWRAYALKRPGSDPRRVRDPDFKALPEQPAPFDWTLSNDGGILAQAGEQNGASRLDIEAGSGAAGMVVQQLQMLPPGTYRLIIDAGAVPDGGSLVWSLTCPDGVELTKVAMSSGAARRHAGSSFAVPASCGVQTLKLTADASESPQGLRSEVRRVMLTPVS